MSRYHPLDVRHPANRAAEQRSYLLAPLPRANTHPAPPPAAASAPAPASLSPAALAAARAAGQSPARNPARGGARPRPQAPSATPARREGGLGAFLRSLMILAVILTIVGMQTDLLDPALRQIRLWALDLGIVLPF